MAIMAAAMLLVPLIDAQGKWLSTEEGMSPAQIAAYRFAFQLIGTAVWVAAFYGLAAMKPVRAFPNIARGLIMGATSVVFFTAVKYMPVADAIAIFFVEPLIVTLLSGIFLGEQIGWRRWFAVAAGFAGALLIIQPSFDEFGFVAGLPLLAAVLFSIYMLMSRKLSAHDTALSMQLMAGVGGFAFSMSMLPIGWLFAIENLKPGLPQSDTAILLLFGVALVATVGHFMITVATRLARASVLAPFQYLEIVTATIAGLLIFGNFPTPTKWIGIAIIILSGLYVFWREAKLERMEAMDTRN